MFLLSSSSESPPEARRCSLESKKINRKPLTPLQCKAALVKKYILLCLHEERQMRWIQIEAEETQYVMPDQIPGCSHFLCRTTVHKKG